jgi:hypothetical protein
MAASATRVKERHVLKYCHNPSDATVQVPNRNVIPVLDSRIKRFSCFRKEKQFA